MNQPGYICGPVPQACGGGGTQGRWVPHRVGGLQSGTSGTTAVCSASSCEKAASAATTAAARAPPDLRYLRIHGHVQPWMRCLPVPMP